MARDGARSSGIKGGTRREDCIVGSAELGADGAVTTNSAG